MRIVVPLSAEDQWKIEQIASARSTLARERAIVTQKIDAMRSDRAIDLDGMRGEWAVAKWLGEIPSYALRPDDGWDLWVGGKRADVKTTRHANGRLLIKSRAAVTAEVYILAILEADDQVRIPGWCSQKDYLAKATEFSNYGHVGLALTQDQLRPMGELLEIVQTARMEELCQRRSC